MANSSAIIQGFSELLACLTPQQYLLMTSLLAGYITSITTTDQQIQLGLFLTLLADSLLAVSATPFVENT